MVSRLARLVAVMAIVVAMPAVVADPPKSLKPFGHFDAVLGDLGDKSITIKRTEVELASKSISRSSRPKVQQVEKEYDYDLAPEAMFRRQDLPKGKGGKAPSYTKEEYAALREPLSAPGYKASRDDFKPGQVVRLFLARETERDRPVVTTVMLIRDTPDSPKPPDEKPKKSDGKSKKADDKSK